MGAEHVSTMRPDLKSSEMVSLTNSEFLSAEPLFVKKRDNGV